MVPGLVELFPVAPQLVFELPDFRSQGEGVDARKLVFKLLTLFRAEVSAVDKTAGRSAALLLMTPDLAASFPPFALLFHRHAEEVAPLAPELEEVRAPHGTTS